MDTRGIEYRPVNLERREIRLLEIQNGINIHDPLVCRLATYKVHPDLEFVGLSTLWRDQDDNHTEPIWVNSRRVVVPATIGQALRNVRALFLADQEYLYQTASNTSQSRANSVKSSSSSSPNGTNGHSYHPQSKDTAVARPKKTPGWLKHLLRGFKSILPDDTSPGAVRKAPLRVWVDCLCMDLKNDRETALRRSHVALAYGSAKITVGWLGLKDDTTDIAIGILRRLDSLCPTGFGDPEDRLLHPENYSPVMKWLAPIGDEWNADAKSGGAREQGAMYTAATKFLSRPFFHRQWIVEELTLSKFPAFLMGDEIISWMQLLNWNRMNGKLFPFHFRDAHSPKPLVPIACYFSFGIYIS